MTDNVHVHASPDQEILIIPKGRRVVTVPAWVPQNLIWRAFLAGFVIMVALILSTGVVWVALDDKTCEATREATLSTAESVRRGQADFDDPEVDAGLAKIARRIRAGAETC